jgi:hypothetical protein
MMVRRIQSILDNPNLVYPVQRDFEAAVVQAREAK